ncbi:MAG: peptidase family protein, partial [Akkermansiaceae bacterium]|nr:peptidase family protein [Akkermansiaceae bacterium]
MAEIHSLGWAFIPAIRGKRVAGGRRIRWIGAMRYDPIDPQLFVRNRARLRALMKPNSIAIVLANDIYPTNADGLLPFKQNADLFYLSGVDQEETVLVMMPGAQDVKEREILFVKETSEQIAIWDGEKLNKEQARAATGIDRVEWTGGFESWLHRLVPQIDHIYLVTNEHLRAGVIVETANDRFIKKIQARYPLHRYERLSPLMYQLRMIKDPVEVAIMQKACKITEAGFRRLLGFVKPGVGEWEVEAELLHEFVRRGSRGFAYGPIVGSGANACVLHYIDNDKPCKDGDLLLLDVAAE